MPDLKQFKMWDQGPEEELDVTEIISRYDRGFAGALPSTVETREAFGIAVVESGGILQAEDAAYANSWAGSHAGKLVSPWLYANQVYPGCWPGPAQARGDCVSHSGKNARLLTLICEIVAATPDEISGKIEMAPVVSAEGIKNGVLSTEAAYWFRGHGGDGWQCESDARVALKNAGCVLRQNYDSIGIDLTKYSGSLAGKYGRSAPPENIRDVLDNNLIRTATNADSFEEIRDLLGNGYAVSSCGSEGFSSTRDENGVSKRSGSWSHAMCYSSDTEILTDRGWKYVTEVTREDVLATLNPNSHCLEWEVPRAIHKYEFEGELHHFKRQSIDFLVTPNHRMYGIKNSRRHPKEGEIVDDPKEYEFIRADECTGSFVTKKNSDWEGAHVLYHELPLGTKVPMDIWLEFLGYFISEGHTYYLERARVRASGNTCIRKIRRTSIAQKKPEGVSIIQKCLDKLPFKFHRDNKNHRWTCETKEIWMELNSSGKADAKRIPDYVWTCTKHQLKILFDALMLGDGTKRLDGSDCMYITASKKLAGDVQKLCLAIGKSGTTRKVRTSKGSYSKKGFIYNVAVLNEHFHCALGKAKLVPYSGYVYCPTTVNGIVMVRRNGKMGWCGNSYIGADDRPEIHKAYGEPLILVLNSWGRFNSGPTRVLGTSFDIPQGSFWARWSHVKNRRCIAFSAVNGWPQKNLPPFKVSVFK